MAEEPAPQREATPDVPLDAQHWNGGPADGSNTDDRQAIPSQGTHLTYSTSAIALASPAQLLLEGQVINSAERLE
jgi:hypothetical protein